MLVCASSSSCSPSHQPWSSSIPTLHLLPKCTTSQHVKQLHARITTTGLIKNTSFTTKLVLTFISSPHAPLVEFARYMFFKHHATQDQHGDDPFLWNAVIRSYSHGGCDPRGALVVLCFMHDNGVNLDKYSFSLALKACSQVGLLKECGCVELARQVFDRMSERDAVSYNSMIDGYVKCGVVEKARELFDGMLLDERNLITWNSMIGGKGVISCNSMMAGYVQNGYCIEALKLFHDMRRATNMLPDDTTLLIVLTAIAQLGQVEFGIAIHRYVIDNGHSLIGKLGVALIDMYSKCGSIEEAISVFENIERKCVDHWNALIGGFAIHGMGEMAFEFFMEMERLSITPDSITFIGLLSALQHYGCIVDMFSRAGKVEQAKQFIEMMPIEPNDVIWKTLISACQNHQNFSIGEPVAKQLVQLSSCTPSYVLLSNIYASLGMWENVKRVRTEMKEKNLIKVPGCSWIELEGCVHQFSVHDRTHHQVSEIYSLLRSM
ncbi:hypothetical protein Ahy_A02g005376 isoform A [Arachis hypogaea]|uniref:Pentatricopeptide repeat-containing protein n=1 Tax=Arachis hypogaea TaxID=3818 RepID=A0A445E6J9_ARAHY|nr:hypothetical protein Ahy_A02g005376 isoform A [Arachis hypogaea]